MYDELMKYFKLMCKFWIIEVFFLFNVFYNHLLADEKKVEVRFHIRTTSASLFITTNVPEILASPSLDVLLETADTHQPFWKGQIEGRRIDNEIVFMIDSLHPQQWSPAHPYLYKLTIVFPDKNGEIQKAIFRIGFRDFETKNGKIYLNGYPIFLRGIAINPPGRGIPREVETSRIFAEEYVRFMKSINVNIIRIPDDQIWYDVCDELGMMVFGGNYSGSVDNEKPPTDFDKAVKWYKNIKFGPIMYHPSLMIYALTNEVPYTGVIAQQWAMFLDYAFEKLKRWDNTRLYIGNAGYGYGQGGDICDLHRYWGWYYGSPFTFLHVRDYEKIVFPDQIQPLTFTECVGNYTGPDGRYNLTPNHKNPVSQLHWTGHASQKQQAQLADQHQCFVFKQATELMRRLRRINHESSGVFPFTIMFRNWHTINAFSDMEPKAVAWQARLSYQPVLLSWENWQSQVYTGSTIYPIAHVINDADDFSDLKNIKLIVRLLDKAFTPHVVDTVSLSDIPYYGIISEKIEIRLPENLFEGNYRLEGIVLSNGKEVSRNFTELFLARHAIVKSKLSFPVKLYDPQGITEKAFNENGICFKKITDFNKAIITDCLIIGENSADSLMSKQSSLILDLVEKGGRLIILKQDSLHQIFLNHILPIAISFPSVNIDDPSYPPPPRPSRNSFNINPERPLHPVFKGITRNELRMWSDYTGWNETKTGFPAIYPVTDGFVLRNKQDIYQTAILANYSVGLEGIALAEIFHGKGSILLSGFDLSNRAGIDPVSDRLLCNMVHYMSGNLLHENHLLITTPILWGEYETEKGIVTGIYNGLMVNSRPALFGSYEKLPLLLEKDGSLFAGKRWGWNTEPGKQYVPYGRRIFGPYIHLGFGGVPTPVDPDSRTGKAFFWCKVPKQTMNMKTFIWNPANESLGIKIGINSRTVSEEMVGAGEFRWINSEVPKFSTTLKIELEGDRRLVILETAFF